MKTTVVPAQITTVEDRIAGNFTFSQIILLVIPLLTSTAVYVVLPPHSKFNALKLILIASQFLIFGAMAIRIRGKLLVDWLVIFVRFMLRPHIYVFTKKDQTARGVVYTKQERITVKDPSLDNNEITAAIPLTLKEQKKISELFTNPSLTFRFGVAKKGGIDVSLASHKD